MYTLPDSVKKIRDRATRYKRALSKEQDEYGHINDGAGKRYLVGPLYILAGETQSAMAYYGWYEQEFEDDVGEPVHFLYWALALRRSGRLEESNTKLLEAMLSNVYMLPILFGIQRPDYDIWHSSNREYPDYLDYVPEEFLSDVSESEKNWFREQYESQRFRVIRNEYVSTYRALKYEKDVEKRTLILRRWHGFLSSSFCSTGR